MKRYFFVPLLLLAACTDKFSSWDGNTPVIPTYKRIFFEVSCEAKQCSMNISERAWIIRRVYLDMHNELPRYFSTLSLPDTLCEEGKLFYGDVLPPLEGSYKYCEAGLPEFISIGDPREDY